LRMGLLQFRTQHNLQDSTCLPDDCHFTMDEEADIDGWLDQLATISKYGGVALGSRHTLAGV
jgi:hypothetical protein